MKDKFEKIEKIDNKESIRRMIDRHLKDIKMEEKNALKLVKKTLKEEFPNFLTEDLTLEITRFSDGDFIIKYFNAGEWDKEGVLLFNVKHDKSIGRFKEGIIYKKIKELEGGKK